MEASKPKSPRLSVS